MRHLAPGDRARRNANTGRRAPAPADGFVLDNEARFVHGSAMRLADALAALDARSFERLCRRQGIDVDPKRRLRPAEQAARQLADLPRRTIFAELPEPARQVAWLLAAQPDGAPRRDLGGGALALLSRDLVFPMPGAPDRIAMPDAFRLSVPLAPGEDRASLRALLASLDAESAAQLGTTFLGRRPVGPPVLWLGALLEKLESEAGIDELLSRVSPKQRRLLEAIEARGGQLETDELLELERSPIRVALATLPTRSASHHLFLHGLLLPRARGVWAVPTEVAERVGAARRAVVRAERIRLLTRVTEDEDLSPTRAALSEDPGALAVAALAILRAKDALPSDVRAVRRSDIAALAADLGISREDAELIVVLARAAGARLAQSTLGDAGAVLFATWYGGDAWDEARRDPDAHRASEAAAQLVTPTRTLREVILELLEPMPPDRFAPLDELIAASVRDLRSSGAARMLERAARRNEVLADPKEVARRILLRSLPAIGAVDRGRLEGNDIVRLSARARRWREHKRIDAPTDTRWESARLIVGTNERVRTVLIATELAHAIATQGTLVLRVDEASVRRALERGLSASDARERLEALAPIDPSAERAIAAALEALRPRVRAVAASFFLPIDEGELRARIENDPTLRELLVLPSPGEGLLVREGVNDDELARGLQALGVLFTKARS